MCIMDGQSGYTDPDITLLALHLLASKKHHYIQDFGFVDGRDQKARYLGRNHSHRPADLHCMNIINIRLIIYKQEYIQGG